MIKWVGSSKNNEVEERNRVSSYRGYLLKMRRSNNLLAPQWGKRWFSIEGRYLRWYRTESDVQHSGMVDLRHVRNITKVNISGCFTLCVTCEDRNLIMRCANQQEMSHWIRALHIHADIARGGSGTNVVSDFNEIPLRQRGMLVARKNGKLRMSLSLQQELDRNLHKLNELEKELLGATDRLQRDEEEAEKENSGKRSPRRGNRSRQGSSHRYSGGNSAHERKYESDDDGDDDDVLSDMKEFDRSETANPSLRDQTRSKNTQGGDRTHLRSHEDEFEVETSGEEDNKQYKDRHGDDSKASDSSPDEQARIRGRNNKSNGKSFDRIESIDSIEEMMLNSAPITRSPRRSKSQGSTNRSAAMMHQRQINSERQPCQVDSDILGGELSDEFDINDTPEAMKKKNYSGADAKSLEGYSPPGKHKINGGLNASSDSIDSVDLVVINPKKFGRPAHRKNDIQDRAERQPRESKSVHRIDEKNRKHGTPGLRSAWGEV